MEKVLEFLHDLSAHNDRDWFNDHKARYTESREKMLFLTELLIHEVRKFDPHVPLLEAKDCLFRIYRDVRFSKDKRPYKTHFGGYISQGGRKGMYAGYYYHIDPAGSFVGGGAYRPAAEQLRSIRNRMAMDGADFLNTINHPDFKKIFPEMMDDQLKTAPKGFPKEHEFMDLLRYKSFAFSTSVSTAAILKGDFVEKSMQAFQRLMPVNLFLNEAMQEK